MKLYENWFGHIEYNNKLESGLTVNVHASYEDRLPLMNTTDYSFFNKADSLLPNHPYELALLPFKKTPGIGSRHQCKLATRPTIY